MSIFIKRQKETAAFVLPFMGAILVILLGMLLFAQQTWAHEHKLEFAIDKTGILIFDGKLPKTYIHFNKGDHVTVRLKNTTDSKHGIRWHGVYLMEAQDSDSLLEVAKRFYVIQKVVEPGEVVTHRWKVGESGTFWYHCHLDGHNHPAIHKVKKVLPAPSTIFAEREQPAALAEK